MSPHVGERIEENITPYTNILLSITSNAMKPIDSLCELIDNAIDNFRAAQALGEPIKNPAIQISIPKVSEILRGEGKLIVIDNGYGMSKEEIVNSATAGYSSKNPFENLGLFGLGFNISTGKLGKRTKITSTRKTDKLSVSLTINLEDIVSSDSYNVYAVYEEKGKRTSGTKIEIDSWWEEGTFNSGFITKLSKIGIPKTAQEIGRRYSTYIREKGIKIIINGKECNPFEHCIWEDQRYVTHKKHGLIPAVFRFNVLLKTEKRCGACNTLLRENACINSKCSIEGNVITREHRVRGWVGIQRFDDKDNFGIDLVRNGRVIRKSEKDAFFKFTDNLGNTITDYPVDGIFGRIVGEVHIDHVPTDFLKQDFQRTSTEWEDFIIYLRGSTSLQPTKADSSNESPIYKLYQGYRSIRNVGTKDLYMGYWEPGASKPSRISREVEKEYYEKFLQKEDGFYDDKEWWKLVEQADKQQKNHLIECPECKNENLFYAEICNVCSNILKGKDCINVECSKTLPKSAQLCEYCGVNQLPSSKERWKCAFCGRKNAPHTQVCRFCQKSEGEANVFSLEYLQEHSHKNDELSIEAFSIPLPQEATMSTIDVNVYTVKHEVNLIRDNSATPVVFHKGNALELFLDVNHPIFKRYHVRKHDVVAIELAKWIQDQNTRFMSGDIQQLFSISSLYAAIIKTYWDEEIALDSSETRRRVETFFLKIKEELPYLLSDDIEDVRNNLSQEEKNILAVTMVNNGVDPGDISEMLENGEFLTFLQNNIVAKLIIEYPERVFDGNLWSDSYKNIDSSMNVTNIFEIRELIINRYRNLLEDLQSYLTSKNVDEDYTKRVNQTLELVQKNMVF